MFNVYHGGETQVVAEEGVLEWNCETCYWFSKLPPAWEGSGREAMTEAELAAIEERASKATAGPWTHEESETRLHYVQSPSMWGHETEYRGGIVLSSVYQSHHIGLTPPDAEFVAHARNDIPALIAEIRRLWAIKEVHKEVQEELLKLFASGTKSLFDERKA